MSGVLRGLGLLAAAAIVVSPLEAMAAEVVYYVQGDFARPDMGSFSGQVLFDTRGNNILRADISVTEGRTNDGSALSSAARYNHISRLGSYSVVATSAPYSSGSKAMEIHIYAVAGELRSVGVVDSVCENPACETIKSDDNLTRGRASATLSLTPPPAPVPSLSQWSMILFGLALGGTALLGLGQFRRTRG